MAQSQFVSFIFNLKPAVENFWSLSNVTFNITLKACVMLYLWSSQYFQIHKCHKPQNSGNAKPDNYLDTCVAVTYFFPSGLHSFEQCYILPEQKNRSCILCSCFILFIRAKKITSCIAMQSHPFPWVSFIQTVDVLQTKLSQTSFLE